MTLRLPRFIRAIPLVEKDGTPSLTFHQWWETTMSQIEKSVEDIKTALAVAGVALDGASSFPTFSSQTITTNITLSSSDDVVLVDATVGPVTVTLAPAADRQGLKVSVKKVDSSANAVTVAANGSETIDGAATKDLASQYDNLTAASDGTTWWLL